MGSFLKAALNLPVCFQRADALLRQAAELHLRLQARDELLVQMGEERRPLERAAREKEELLDVASEVRRSGLRQLVGFFGCGAKSVMRDESSFLMTLLLWAWSRLVYAPLLGSPSVRQHISFLPQAASSNPRGEGRRSGIGGGGEGRGIGGDAAAQAAGR